MCKIFTSKVCLFFDEFKAQSNIVINYAIKTLGVISIVYGGCLLWQALTGRLLRPMTPELLFLALVGLVAVIGFTVAIVIAGIKSIRQDSSKNKVEVKHEDKQEQILPKGLEITIKMNIYDTKDRKLDKLFSELARLAREDYYAKETSKTRTTEAETEKDS